MYTQGSTRRHGRKGYDVRDTTGHTQRSIKCQIRVFVAHEGEPGIAILLYVVFESHTHPHAGYAAFNVEKTI